MIVLGIDFETTGLDPEADAIIEMGAVLWDTDGGIPLRMVNMLLRDETDAPLSDEIQELTGISNGMLATFGQQRHLLAVVLRSMIPHATAFVAHNGESFDRKFLATYLRRLEMEEFALPWIDTMLDLPLPEGSSRRLNYIAADHGFLNPFAHRALFDVLTMLKVMQGYNAAGALQSAEHPVVTVEALVSFDDKDKAKERGYHWEPEIKSWRKTMRSHYAETEATEAGFRVRFVEEKKF